VITIRSFSDSWLIIGFVTWVTRLVSLEEKEWLTLTEHTSSPPFNICISRYRVFYFVKSLVFTFFCSCCDVCYDFRIKTMFGLVFTLSCFINVILYLFTYTNVQYDFHNRRRLCSLTFYVVFCRSLFVLFLWPLCCLYFLDWWILSTPIRYLQILPIGVRVAQS
jgi:hypothetical protein